MNAALCVVSFTLKFLLFMSKWKWAVKENSFLLDRLHPAAQERGHFKADKTDKYYSVTLHL